MLNTATAWFELLKLGNVTKIRQDINTFWRGNVIRVLATEGWLPFLKEFKTKEEIISNFDYSDEEFLSFLLNILVKDKTLICKSNKFRVKEPVNTDWVLPSVFDDRMKDLWWNFANFIPKRLKGEFFDFSGGFNLFNWDNILSNKMYSQIRKSAFSYVKKFKNNSSFLDVGSGNGYSTSSIWVDFQQSKKTDQIKITGLEQDVDLLDIAKSEFERMVKKIANFSLEDIREKKEHYPEFVKGTVLDLPFQDETFDYLYASQVLHWTDAEKAVQEMIRVTKKGGTIFGTQNFIPDADPFNDLHFKVIKGAKGFFSKSEMKTWAYRFGARQIKFSTPISIFLIIK